MQLTLDFTTGPASAYRTCREYVAALVHQQGRPQKSIAADMDYSPSQLTRKLAQGDGDSARFTLDDLETFIEVTNDVGPLYYLIEKYICPDGEIAALEKKLAQMKANRAMQQGHL